MIVEMDNIELSYNTKSILHGVYLKGETGRVTGILGSNGTGKTSLLNILFGHLQPQKKLIKIDSKPLFRPLFVTGMVKLLPQQHLLPSGVKIYQAFRMYKVSWTEFCTRFPTFEKYRTAGIHELSGGERRVMEIYLSLCSPSSIVLLDEPFSHLSPVNIEKIKPLIRETCKEKVIFMTDHMYREVIDMADDLYFLKNGCSKMINNLKELEDYHYLNPNTL